MCRKTGKSEKRENEKTDNLFKKKNEREKEEKNR